MTVQSLLVDIGGPDSGRYWRVTTDHAPTHPDAVTAATYARVTGAVSGTHNDVTVVRYVDYTRLPDRNGEPIACHHEWHYAADGLPRCHDGSQGRRCEGYTVQCGKGHAPCERHADRRPVEIVEDPEPADDPYAIVSYTVTLDVTEAVVAELAIEARIRMLSDLRAELLKNLTNAKTDDERRSAAGSYDSCGDSLRTAGAVLAKLKRAPGNSPALDRMIRPEDNR